jgi:hypothetical protein
MPRVPRRSLWRRRCRTHRGIKRRSEGGDVITNGYRTSNPPDLATGVAVLALLSPVLAVPVGLAWRVLTWVAGA